MRCTCYSEDLNYFTIRRMNDLNHTNLFNELQNLFGGFRSTMGDFEVNHIIINLYLVIAGGRRGFLLDTYAEPFRGQVDEVLEKVNYIVKKYNLNIAVDDGYLISKEQINPNRLKNEMYLAYMLDFGCLDPNYNDFFQPQIIYNYYAHQNEEAYYIMTFVCTLPHAVPEDRYMEIAKQFEDALNLMGSDWSVRVNTEHVTPPRRRRGCTILGG